MQSDVTADTIDSMQSVTSQATIVARGRTVQPSRAREQMSNRERNYQFDRSLLQRYGIPESDPEGESETIGSQDTWSELQSDTE